MGFAIIWKTPDNTNRKINKMGKAKYTVIFNFLFENKTVRQQN